MSRLSQKIDEAIRSLYENPDVGYNALGCSPVKSDVLGLQKEKELPTSLPPLIRGGTIAAQA